MKVIIVEDERIAIENMKYLLNEVDGTIEIMASLQSIEEAISWLTNNPQPDLAFFDIQISDGISFEIIEKTKLNFPIVFTTAFNEFAIQAFKVNSIDYLLKPIKKSDLEFSINKFEKLPNSTKINQDFDKVIQLIANKKNKKQSLLIKTADGFFPVSITNFDYFFSENSISYGITDENKKHIVDNSLDELEIELPEQHFFRVNRQLIVHRKTIHSISFYFNGRLILKPKFHFKEQIIVSKAKGIALKKWL